MVSLDSKHFFPMEFVKSQYDSNSLTGSAKKKKKVAAGKALLMKEDEGEMGDEEMKNVIDEDDEAQ